MPTRPPFPHMFGAEADIWRDFLALHEDEYLFFEYDLHVGKIWPALEEMPEPWRKGAEGIYRKRIDVIGHQPGKVTIFEVKPHAGLGALGQIMGYAAMYEEEFSPKEELAAAIVTRLIDPNMEKIYADFGIDTFIFPE